MKILMFIIFFLLLGAFYILSENNIPLNSTYNIQTFLSSYFSWVDEITDNTTTVTGYIIGMKWLPE